MPFSSQFEQQFIELVHDAIARVKFETKEDIALFCQAVRLKLNAQSTEQVSSSKYDEDISDLEELLNDGFDLYATNQIVEKVNYRDLTQDFTGKYIMIPAFTPARMLSARNNAGEDKTNEIKISDAEKIIEAKEEFKKIIHNQITIKLDELSSMNEAQQIKYIENQNSRRKEAQEKHQIMAAATALPRDPESQTIQEEKSMEIENPSMDELRRTFPGLFMYADDVDNTVPSQVQESQPSPSLPHHEFNFSDYMTPPPVGERQHTNDVIDQNSNALSGLLSAMDSWLEAAPADNADPSDQSDVGPNSPSQQRAYR